MHTFVFHFGDPLNSGRIGATQRSLLAARGAPSAVATARCVLAMDAQMQAVEDTLAACTQHLAPWAYKHRVVQLFMNNFVVREIEASAYKTIPA